MSRGFEKVIYSGGEGLKSNWEQYEETAFFIGDPKKGIIRKYDISTVRGMRKMGDVMTPISVDPWKKVDSVAEVPDSIMACGTCERLSDDEKEVDGVKKGTVRVGFTDGTRVMLCKKHFDPNSIELVKIPDIIGAEDGDEIPEEPDVDPNEGRGMTTVKPELKPESENEGRKLYWWEKD